MRRSPAVLLPVVVLSCTFAVAQSPGGAPTATGAAAAAAEPVDAAAVAFFREEGLQRSQVMEHLSWLCDVYGPRLTGSPNLRKAQDWAVQQFAAMGYAATTEAWGP
jgi:carboxypeptidase Q